MPFYVKQGQIPHKRHIAFEKENGELYREELFSTHGFSNIYSNKYHHNTTEKTKRQKTNFRHKKPPKIPSARKK